MLKATKTLLKPIDISVNKAKAVFVTNNMKTNHGAQGLFVKRLYAVIKLTIPKKDKCGGKPDKGKNASIKMPETA